MRAFVRFLVFLLVLAVLVGGGAWFWAGRSAGPTITIRQPGKFVGQNSSLELLAEAPEGKFTAIDVTVEQSGKSFPVFTLDQPQGDMRQESAERLYVMRPVGKRAIPDLQSGPARIVVTASRPVLFGLRQRELDDDTRRAGAARAAAGRRALDVSLHQPRRQRVRRLSRDAGRRGVRACASATSSTPASRRAQSASQPIPRCASRSSRCCSIRTSTRDFNVFARDPAGNEALAALDHQVFPKPYSKSRIEIDDRFLGRVVPAIAGNSPQEKIPTDDLLAGFLKINGDLRRKNNQYLTDLAKKSAPEMLFKGRVPAAGQLAGRGAIRRHAHLRLQGQGSRPAGAPRLRSRRHRQRPDRRRGARDDRPRL